MVIGFIVFLFCCVGIYGFYNGYIYLTYIGFALSLIEQIYGTIKGEQKGLGLIPFCLLLAIGATIAGNNFFESISIIFCQILALMVLRMTLLMQRCMMSVALD